MTDWVTDAVIRDHVRKVMVEAAGTRLDGYWRAMATRLSERNAEELAWALAAALAKQE
jgi:hypothetical protein